MKISKDARRTSRQLFRACLNEGVLDEGRVRAVVQKVSESKPRGYIGILGAFSVLVRTEVERQRALVESATALGDGIKSELQTGLSKKYGRPLNVEFSVKPELIGGIRVRVGSDVWDGSVKSRLELLHSSLA
ncbi:MAG: F0F1 ATP synthase subunit delta [Verrucomicrobiaceae bacterium]|nr:F0F1 ATP synthase subunit delta [Verrucomicrobiaceae bacterium]